MYGAAKLFIPEKIKSGDQVLTHEAVVVKLKEALTALVTNPKMGAGVLGAIQNEKTLHRVHDASAMGSRACCLLHLSRMKSFPNHEPCHRCCWKLQPLM